MSEILHRRQFLQASAAGVALGATVSVADEPTRDPMRRLVVGVMGTGGRGTEHARNYQQQANVDVAYVCDVDRRRAEQAAQAVERAGGRNTQVVTDYRRILDDRSVDILIVATCNHWHAPAAILGCAAGKHVYVEKPCSHSPREGEWMVQAARRHRRLVQMGNQRRSWPKIIEAIAAVRDGSAIGRAYFAQAWYLNNRPTIGRQPEGEVPAGLDYDGWQGPASRRPYHSNYLHYNWHWFWHWGNGELGNNGIHMIDVCRWGLNVDLPTRVTSAGGRYRFDDDQETPDTNVVTYEFAGRKSISWEGLSCSRPPSTRFADVIFHGENGTLIIDGGNYAIYDPTGREVRKVNGEGGDTGHIRNFLNAIRGEGTLNSEIEEGAKSTLLCHLGNISYRTRRALNCDPRTGHIVNDAEAMRHWTREYADGWETRLREAAADV